VPDYANQETINRASTAGWTVERDGFLNIMNFSMGQGNINVYINDVSVAQSIGTSVFANPQNVIAPVKKGDVVRYEALGGNGNYCYFIPPTFIGIEFAPVVAENFKNYQCIPDYANMTGNIGTGTNPIT
jgi:hypothetical protein